MLRPRTLLSRGTVLLLVALAPSSRATTPQPAPDHPLPARGVSPAAAHNAAPISDEERAARVQRMGDWKRTRQEFGLHPYNLAGGAIKPDHSPEVQVADHGLEPLKFTITSPERALGGLGSDARIQQFESPSMDNEQNQPRWNGPGDTVKFRMQVNWAGQASADHVPFIAAVHTNMNADPAYEDYPMRFVRKEGNQYLFEADIPAWRVVNYRATGVITPRSGPDQGKAIHWAGKDIVARPYDVSYDHQSAAKVSVMNLGREGQVGTFEDMMGAAPGLYSLQHLKERGFNAVELNPIQPRAESPYSQSELFLPWAALSKPAQQVLAQLENEQKGNSKPSPARVHGLEKQAARLALRSFKNFVDEAHAKGIKVILDVVRNHMSTDAAMNDVVFYDSAGREVDIFDRSKEGQAVAFSVRRNDPHQLIQNGHDQVLPSQEARRRMDADEGAGAPLSLQSITPHVFGKPNNPHGASSPWDYEAGGWGQWPGDTQQLNTGSEMLKGPHGEYTWQWVDRPATAENLITRSYLRRELALWTLLGVDGFRFDHAQGTTTDEWEHGYNDLQRVAWAYRRANLYLNAEDWNTQDRTLRRVDTLEVGGSLPMLKSKNPGELRLTYDSWVGGSNREHSVAGNHDEEFGNTSFQNPHAYALRLALNELMGGPTLTKAGDERTQLGANRYFMDPNTKIWTLSHSNDAVDDADRFSGIMRSARQDLPGLHGREHDWLHHPDGSWDPDIFAVARFPERGNAPAVLGFGNFHGSEDRIGTFQLTDRVTQRLDSGKQYMAFSVGDMKFVGQRNGDYHAAWSLPKSGADLKANGIWVRLAPNELQALELREVHKTNDGRWVPVDRPGEEAPRAPRRSAVEFAPPRAP